MSLRPAPWPLFGTAGARRAGQPSPLIRKPDLRVLEGGNAPRLERLSPRTRLVLLVLMVSVVLFGVVAFHVVLSQGQFRLEKLQAAANEQQVQYERLRLDVARLESPARITNEAKNRLGMVPAQNVTPVAPRPEDQAKDAPVASTLVSSAAGDGLNDWTTLKPHLSSVDK